MKTLRLLSLLAISFFCSCEKEEEPPIITYIPSVVEIGTKITITGKNFGDPPRVGGKYIPVEVYFNGVPSTNVFVREKGIISCLVPDNITPGKITVSVNSMMAESLNEYIVSNWKLVTSWPSQFNGNGDDFEIGYILCKYNNSLFFLFFGSENSILEFNLDTKIWKKELDIPYPNGPGLFFAIGNRIYFYRDDENGGEVQSFFEYNLDTNQWTKKGDLPIYGAPLPSLGFSIAGKGYLLFGKYGSKVLRGYDPSTDTWTQLADFPGILRKDYSTYQTPTHFYFGAGHLDNGVELKDRWQYEPISNTWTKVEDFPGNPRSNPIIFNINNHIYYGLGFGDSYEFNPAVNSWMPFQNLISDIYLISGGGHESYFSYEDKAYLNFQGRVWEFNP